MGILANAIYRGKWYWHKHTYTGWTRWTGVFIEPYRLWNKFRAGIIKMNKALLPLHTHTQTVRQRVFTSHYLALGTLYLPMIWGIQLTPTMGHNFFHWYQWLGTITPTNTNINIPILIIYSYWSQTLRPYSFLLMLGSGQFLPPLVTPQSPPPKSEVQQTGPLKSLGTPGLEGKG